MKPYRSQFEKAQRLFIAFFIFVLFVILCIWTVAGVAIYKSASVINEKGLRGAFEQLYCGKTPDCTLPGVK